MDFNFFLKRLPVALVFFLLAGCAGPLKVNYAAAPWEPPFKLDTGEAFSVREFEDAREDRSSRTIGSINAVVSNMTGRDLVVSEDVTAIVGRAFEEEIRGAGLALKDDPEAPDIDYIITGDVRRFRLDIGSRDEIDIELSVKIIENRTDRVLWSGVVDEKDDRYAGVMGNSRRTVSAYITSSLSKVVKKALSDASPYIKRLNAEAPPVRETESKPLEQGLGRLVITTDPPRSKVYIDDVYYGLSPLTLDLEPGVYRMRFSIKGFADEEEKVAVGEGRITELEISFEER